MPSVFLSVSGWDRTARRAYLLTQGLGWSAYRARKGPRSAECVHPEDQHLDDREHEHEDDAGIQQRMPQNERHNRSRSKEPCDEPRKRRAVPEPPGDERLDSDGNDEASDARVGVARQQHREVYQRKEDRVGEDKLTRRGIGHRTPEDTRRARPHTRGRDKANRS